MNPEELIRRAGVWRAGELLPSRAQSTGFAGLDRLLPGGGWPGRGLTEILSDVPGIGALRLVLPALARLTRADGWVIWVSPPYVPYPPALEAAGLDLSRTLVVDLPEAAAADGRDILWAYEQALQFRDCAAALLWPGAMPPMQLRRLQLAAESSSCWGLLFRPRRYAALPSPAALRLVAGPAGADELELTLLKARGARGGAQCRLQV